MCTGKQNILKQIHKKEEFQSVNHTKKCLLVCIFKKVPCKTPTSLCSFMINNYNY